MKDAAALLDVGEDALLRVLALGAREGAIEVEVGAILRRPLVRARHDHAVGTLLAARDAAWKSVSFF